MSKPHLGVQKNKDGSLRVFHVDHVAYVAERDKERAYAIYPWYVLSNIASAVLELDKLGYMFRQELGVPYVQELNTENYWGFTEDLADELETVGDVVLPRLEA